MRCIISLQADTKEKFYLTCLYPVSWSGYISNAMGFESIEYARGMLTSRHSQLSESLKGDYNRIKQIEFELYDNGKMIGKEKYLN